MLSGILVDFWLCTVVSDRFPSFWTPGQCRTGLKTAESALNAKYRIWFPEVSQQDPTISDIALPDLIYHFTGGLAVFSMPTELRECMKRLLMHHNPLRLSTWDCLSVIFSDCARSDFGSFGHSGDPDRKILNYDKRLGIENHLIFGISQIGPLSFEKINL